MVKNVIIGILLVVSLFFFFYGFTQQIKAEQAMEQYRNSQKESIKLKEELQAAQQEAIKQAELIKNQFEQTEKARKE